MEPMQFKSATIVKREKRWQAQITYIDEKGKRRRKTKFLSSQGKKAALEELEQFKEDFTRQIGFEGNRMKVGDVQTVADLVLNYIETLSGSGSIELSTYSAYKEGWKRISTAFEGIRYDDLDIESVQGWINESYAHGRAVSTIRKDLNILRATYTNAIDVLRILPFNPTTGVKTPKVIREEPNSLDSAMRSKLLTFMTVMDDTPANIAIRLALLTGMRRGEICALQWRDIDFERSIMKVRRAIGSTGGKFYVKSTKTTSSRRDIPMSDEIRRILKMKRASYIEKCFDFGIQPNPECFVLGSVDGRYLNPTVLSKTWKMVATSLGLVGTEGKIATLRDLRHTFATMAIASGTDVRSVSSIMGHSKTSMTLDIYASADPKAKRDAMEVVDELIKAETRSDFSLVK